MKKDFNPQQYINDYTKDNYKQFNARLTPEEFEKVKKFCKSKKISHRQLILLSFEYLKNKYQKLKK